MTREQKIEYKNKLKRFCQSIIDKRIESLKAAISDTQQTVNLEEKSSAGDKYETSRAMGQLEKDLLTRQMGENIEELAALHSIDCTIIHTAAAAGAYINCGNISFFIAAGLGRHEVEGEAILFLSPRSPLAIKLEGKKISEDFAFNGTNYFVMDLY